MGKDFIQKYKKKKFIGGLGIIAFSLVLALGINFFLLDSTNMGRNLKASILDVNQDENKADLYLEDTGNSIIIKNSKAMQNVNSISFSLIYNPEILEFSGKSTDLGTLITLGETNIGSDVISIDLTQAQNIAENTTILKVNYTKKEQISTSLNMVNANFTDMAENQYNLTTSGITF